MRQNKDTFHKILRQVCPYGHILVISLVFAVISVALTLYAPILVGDALDKILEREWLILMQFSIF